MPRKGSGRYSGYRKLPFVTSVSPSALISDDVASQALSQQMTETRRVLSMEMTAEMKLTTGTGPVEFGVAHSDYTAAEIEEAIEATGAWDEGDLVALERSKRLVRSLGTLETGVLWNDGQTKKIRLNWRIATGDTLQFWVRNRSGANITGEIPVTGYLHTVRAP